MAYDETLAERVRRLLDGRGASSEREMFGGIGFMVAGNMALGVIDQNLIVRLNPEDAERALGEEHVREFDYTGRSMRGWIYVEPPATASDEELAAWVDEGFGFASSLPPK